MEKKERRSSEVEIDIVPLLKAILSKLWLIFLVGLIVAVIVFGATKMFVKPTYRSGFTAYVNNQHAQVNKDSVTYSDLNAAKQLVDTYKRILRSNTVLTAAADSINSDLSYGQLKKMVTTENQGDTEIISVYVVDNNPQRAYDLANAIANTAPQYMAEIVEGSSMKIVDYPIYSEKRYGPSYVKYALFGFLFGFLLVLIIIIVKYFRDDTIKSESELEARFSLPVLGVIPDIMQLNSSSSDYYYKSYGYEQSHSGKHVKDNENVKVKENAKVNEQENEKG